MTIGYPVPGRSDLRNRRIAAHEIGHTLVGRSLGTFIHSCSIIPDHGPDGYQGRTVRSGPVTTTELETDEVVSICEHLETLSAGIGSNRVKDAEYFQRAQINICELVAGEECERLFHPDLESLGAVHDFTEADAFAKIAVAASPAVTALVDYCKAEARALLQQNRDIADVLVAALIEFGTLDTEQIDTIISAGIVARARKSERERRADWHRRELNAAKFLKGLES